MSAPRTIASLPPPVLIEVPPVPGPTISILSSPDPPWTFSTLSTAIWLSTPSPRTSVSEPAPPSNSSPETARPLKVRVSESDVPFSTSWTTASSVTL